MCLVHRAKLAPSFRATRQLINHGYILINNKEINICSYECNVGDVFRIHPKYINSMLIKQNILNSELNVPEHIECGYRYLVFKLIKIPKIYQQNLSSFHESWIHSRILFW